MQIFGYAHCLFLEVFRPSVFALVISMAAAVVSVGNATQKHNIDLRDLGFSGALVKISD